MKVHIMNLNPDALELIRVGTKTIEMRLYDQNRKQISTGDYIKFIDTSDDSKYLKVRVKELYRYNNFEELYNEFDKIKLGYKKDEIARYTDMELYYSIENINKYGVVGIEVEVIK